jgi:hypothetical protein
MTVEHSADLSSTPSPSEPRRVLIATLTMTAGSGTVTYTRDLAMSLLRRGWLPVVYATTIGAEGERLRQATIPVIDTLASLGGPPDIIHGHHALETLAAIAQFPRTPALFVCHDARTWHSVPPSMPQIGAWVAVDRNCRDRMLFEHGIDESRLHVFLNAIDVRRFRPRPPLPQRPSRALVFSNAASDDNYVKAVREACRARSIELDVIGAAAGAATETPETLLSSYDLVFAKARCALEAMAVGAAVIGCDAAGMSGLVTTGRFDALHELNFGARTLQLPVTAERLMEEIDRYDAADAAVVSQRVREENDSDLIAGQFIELYERLLATPLSRELEPERLAASIERVTQHLYAQFGIGAPPPTPLRSRLIRAPVRMIRRILRRLGL